MDTHLAYKRSHPFAFTLSHAFQSNRPLEDTVAMHAGKNNTNIQAKQSWPLTKTHTFTCTTLKPQICSQPQQQAALFLLSRMLVFIPWTPCCPAELMSHPSGSQHGACRASGRLLTWAHNFSLHFNRCVLWLLLRLALLRVWFI